MNNTNQEEIIRMAREAGWTNYDSQDERFERFAALVAAAEREACARIVDDAQPFGIIAATSAAIRARGTK